MEVAACYIKGRVCYTVELLADMYQAELCGYITTPYTVSVCVSLLQLEAVAVGGSGSVISFNYHICLGEVAEVTCDSGYCRSSCSSIREPCL